MSASSPISSAASGREGGGDPTSRAKAGSGVQALASAAPKLFNAQRFASVGSWAWS